MSAAQMDNCLTSAKRWRFGLWATLLLLLAVGIQLMAMTEWSQAATQLARDAAAAASERPSFKANSRHHTRKAAALSLAGLASLGCGVGFLVRSSRQKEAGAARFMAILVLAVYLLLGLIQT